MQPRKISIPPAGTAIVFGTFGLMRTPFVGPAALASLHLIACVEQPGYFATIDAQDHMDPYGIGLTRWQASLAVPTGPGLGHDPDPAWLKRHAID